MFEDGSDVQDSYGLARKNTTLKFTLAVEPFVDLVFLILDGSRVESLCCRAWLAFSLCTPAVLNFFSPRPHPPPQLLDSGARLFIVCSGSVGPGG